MTVAGAGSLVICRAGGRTQNMVVAGKSGRSSKPRVQSKETLNACKWLGENGLTRNDKDKNDILCRSLYYYLYGLERMCALAGLEKVAGKDWYQLGADYLIENQNADGTWPNEEYRGFEGCSTAWAVLFLSRSTGRTLQAGGFDKSAGAQHGDGSDSIMRALTRPKAKEAADKPPPKVDEIPTKPKPELPDSVAELVDVVQAADPAARSTAAKALLEAVDALPPTELQASAEALLMLRNSSDTEVRRIAYRTAVLLKDRRHVPVLIEGLNERDESTWTSCRDTLTNLSRQRFGPADFATPDEKAAAIKLWKDWWSKQAKP